MKIETITCFSTWTAQNYLLFKNGSKQKKITNNPKYSFIFIEKAKTYSKKHTMTNQVHIMKTWFMKPSHEQFILIYNAFNSIRIHELIFGPRRYLNSKLWTFGTYLLSDRRWMPASSCWVTWKWPPPKETVERSHGETLYELKPK